MIKVEVIEEFTLGKFNELKNITRKQKEQEELTEEEKKEGETQKNQQVADWAKDIEKMQGR